MVSAVALGVIGFIAGSHLVWRSIRPRIKSIALQVLGMTGTVPIVVGVTVFALIPGHPCRGEAGRRDHGGHGDDRPVASRAIAVISESRAVGPFTKLVRGATVVMDVVVVSAFSMALMVSKSLIGEGARR